MSIEWDEYINSEVTVLEVETQNLLKKENSQNKWEIGLVGEKH